MFQVGQFAAETLLKGAPILSQIDQIKRALTKYESGSDSTVYEYFERLKADMDNLESFELEATITPGTEYSYMLAVTNMLQSSLDKLESVNVKAVFFQSRLKSIQRNIDNAAATFSAWYQIALASSLKVNDIKLPVSAIKSLGDSEFSRMMDNQDIDIEAMIMSVEVLLGVLKSHKTLSLEKYKMAKDQINASISNLTPNNEYGNEQLRTPRYTKLSDRYGNHFKNSDPGSRIEVEDDEIEDIENHTQKQLPISEPVEDLGSPTFIKTSIVEVKPITMVDPMLGKVIVTKDGDLSSVTKIEGKPLPVTEDDDEPVLFKKKTDKKSSTPVVQQVLEDEDDFSLIQEAQSKFIGQVGSPAKNISPKPTFKDDDLDDIII